MSKPFFSIITTTYNRADNGLLLECIKSIRNQQKSTSYTYEHIIIDDGSSDSTQDFMQKQSKRDGHLVYIRQENSGPAKAIQNGLKRAKGQFIIILDDDDMLTEESLSMRYEYIKQNKNTDFLYGLAYWIDDYGLPMEPLFQSKKSDGHLYEDLLIENCICAGTPTIRKRLLDDIDWPTWLVRSQDYFLWLESNRPQNTAQVGFMDDYIVYYRYHAANYTAAIDSEDKIRQKQELNARIRDMHDPRLAYLAQRSQFWIGETFRNQEYSLMQIKDRDARIEELQIALNHYAHSRIVRIAVKGRNVIRGQVVDRLLRAGDKIKNSNITFRRTGNDQYVSNSMAPESDPLVTIVTPVYNRSSTVPATVRSILGQTFQDFEYIIVDDGSTDEATKLYLSRLKHPKIKVIHKENGGVASARNTGLEMARGRYVMCLDDDDEIHPTFVEKAVILMESRQDVSIVTYYMKMFGKVDAIFKHATYDPLKLIDDNPIITSSLYRREIWKEVGGYKSNIGYEDWEFWVSAAEHGYFAETIPETLFRYRTAESSRYIDDLSKHDVNSKTIKKLHPQYRQKVSTQLRKRIGKTYSLPEESMLNLSRNDQYKTLNNMQHILVIVPWLPFGGAETYMFNFTHKLTDKYNFSIITGIKDDHVWEDKFQQVTPRIYHLANILPNTDYYYNFIRNYIKTRNVDAVHIVHSGYAFPMLEDLKTEFPNLKVIVTLFNSRVDEYVTGVRANDQFIDAFTSDNQTTISDVIGDTPSKISTQVVPSGIDCEKRFNPDKYVRDTERENLGISPDDLAILYAGRLSEEKNPEVFIRAMDKLTRKGGVKAVIVGDGALRGRCEQLIKTLDNRNIIYVGYQANVAKYLAACDIFVLPSSIEGFPLSILEAMSMGLAIVASNVGAIPEVIKDENGVIIEPGSINDIVEAVNKLARDKKALHKIQSTNRQIASSVYSDEMPAQAYDKLYRGVIK